MSAFSISSFWISLLLVQKLEANHTKGFGQEVPQNCAEAPGLPSPSYSQISSGSAELGIILEGHWEDSEIPCGQRTDPSGRCSSHLRVVETTHTISSLQNFWLFLARGKICLSKIHYVFWVYAMSLSWDIFMPKNIMYSLYIPRKVKFFENLYLLFITQTYKRFIARPEWIGIRWQNPH